MKRSVLLVLLLGTMFTGCGLEHPLVGRWVTTDEEGIESVLFFKGDGTFEAVTRGENLPGRWIFHEETEPPRLELVFQDGGRVETIAKVVGDELMIEPREEDAAIPSRFTARAQKYRKQK